MSKRSLAVGVAALLTVLLAAAGGRYFMKQKIQIHVGESMSDVLQHNTRANFDPKSLPDDTPIIWPVNDLSSETFDVRYVTDEKSLDFPHARLVWATQYAGIVTDIKISVSERLLTLKELADEGQQVSVQLQNAGWLMKGPMPSFEVLQKAVDSGNQTAIDADLASFSKNGVTAVLSLNSPGQGISSSQNSRPSYALDVTFADAGLHDAQSNKLYKERLKVNGTIDKSLPLSYWLDRANVGK